MKLDGLSGVVVVFFFFIFGDFYLCFESPSVLGVSIVENTWNCVALKAVQNHKKRPFCSFTSKQLRVLIKRLFSFNQLQTGEEQYHR